MKFSMRHIFKLIVAATAILLALPPSAGLICQAHTLSLGQGKENQKRAEGLITEGVAALERRDIDAAKNLFQRALEDDPNNELAHTYLGIIADHAGDLAEAERQFAAAAISAPTSPAARNNHGAILLRLGRDAQAAKQFEVSLRLDPKQPG